MDQNQLLLCRRTIDLAKTGFRQASPNPIIGWLAAKPGSVITEGWFSTKYPYQEQLARQLYAIRLSDDTSLFLSTNPFPDEEKLLQFTNQYQIQEVIIASEVGSLLRTSEWFVNRRSYIFQEKRRPYIVLKWAQTSDKFIARSNYDSKWISSPHARKLVHKWRSQESAIWVGNNTYRYDNPQLNVRDWSGEDPIRIAIDPKNSLNQELKVFDQRQPTLYYAKQSTQILPNLEVVKLLDSNNWEELIHYVLTDLYQRKIASVFVEGGSLLLRCLVENRWWDEARVFTSDKTFGQGIAAPAVNKKYLAYREKISGDQLATYYRFNLEAK